MESSVASPRFSGQRVGTLCAIRLRRVSNAPTACSLGESHELLETEGGHNPGRNISGVCRTVSNSQPLQRLLRANHPLSVAKSRSLRLLRCRRWKEVWPLLRTRLQETCTAIVSPKCRAEEMGQRPASWTSGHHPGHVAASVFSTDKVCDSGGGLLVWKTPCVLSTPWSY